MKPQILKDLGTHRIRGVVTSTGKTRTVDIEAESMAEAKAVAANRLGMDPQTITLVVNEADKTKEPMTARKVLLLAMIGGCIVWACSEFYKVFMILVIFTGFGANLKTWDVVKVSVLFVGPPLAMIGILLLIWRFARK